nr:hypothetical protein B0A51_01661 [Rachicladosporium sp. CCFEE 5018]OQO31510.1 hypothetical protein B0A51_01277 [Rachicladosporium sp. CCFEE 5018]
MATPPLSELEPLLASLNTQKAPGASKAKIGSLTKIAVNNIQHEQQITQSLYRALKKAPATHKLGVLYVIDSIIRQWIDGAKKTGLDIHIEGRGEAGTYPAAIKRVTELMPALIDDLLKDLPADQKPKLENILAIWERAGTFPAALLEDSKRKVSTPAAHVNGAGAAPAPPQAAKKPVGEKSIAPVPTRPTHTPVGYPPQHLYDQGLLVRRGDSVQKPASSSAPQVPASTMQHAPPLQHAPAPAPPSQDVNSILAALRMAAPPPQQQPAAQPAAPPAVQPGQLPPNFAAMLGSANGFSQPAAPPQQQPSYPPPPTQFQPPPFMPPGFQPPPGFPAFLPPPPSVPQQYALAPPPPQQAPAPADPLASLRGVLPPNIVNDQQKLIRALNLLQELQKEGVPMDQWGPVIQALDEQSSPPQQSGQYNGYNGNGTSRGRSRSPTRGGNNNNNNNGRGSPVYNAYQGPVDDQRNGRNGNNKQRYRQRSPLRASPLPPSFQPPPPSGQKFVQFDPSLPSDSIRVLSRTLFVGGANGSQTEIAELFGRFGQVASCIPNREKRHAFVKMTTRDYTLAAKAGVDALQSANDRETMGIARQVKWGVGFGPRECFDYTRGESVIPIQRLTDADMKWIKTAPYGGTGGQELVAGMVLEEPDIEIGAGVSSKAMSRRVGPGEQEKGQVHHQHQQQQQQQAPVQQFQQQQQQQQPKRQDNRQHGGGGKRGRHGHHSRDDVGGYGGGTAPQGFVRPEPLTPVAVATPPAVPGFGFTLPGNFR